MNFDTFRIDVLDKLRILPIKPNRFRQHIRDTYFSTRIGIAIIGILFPLILWLVGLMLDVELQSSISDYYHTPMRDVFVGILFAIGASLYLYKGYSTVEDFVLDAAGILAVCVALLPTSCPMDEQCDTFTAPFWHGVSAISFFIAIAYICIFRWKDTLNNEEIDEKNQISESRKKIYILIYRILGAAMIALPLLVWFFYRDTGILVFKLELVAVWVFSAYWIVKTVEINESQLEK